MNYPSPVGDLTLINSDGEIPETKKWIDFGATGEYEVWQCVRYILTTSIRSVTLDRYFGMNMQFVDKPKPIAKLMLTQEIAMRISLFEPRAQFTDVEYSGDESVDGNLSPAVTIDLLVTTPQRV